MAILRIAATGATPRLYDAEAGRDAPALQVQDIRDAAPALADKKPIVILVHGYRYNPFAHAAVNPHEFLFHFDAERLKSDRLHRAASWPLGLGFSADDTTGQDGLCVAFGWDSRPDTRFGRFCAAYADADTAARALLRTVEMIARSFPGHPIDFVAHSLGARVVLSAMRHAADQRRPDLIAAMGRAILLGPAELAIAARRALASVDAVARGRPPEIYAFLARENDVFDVLLERFAPPLPGPRRIGIGARGLGADRGNWLAVQLDRAGTTDWLAERGATIEGAPRRACHWGVYNRPGALDLYSAMLRDRPRWSIAAMRAAGVPEDMEPRWCRLPWFRGAPVSQAPA